MLSYVNVDSYRLDAFKIYLRVLLIFHYQPARIIKYYGDISTGNIFSEMSPSPASLGRMFTFT